LIEPNVPENSGIKKMKFLKKYKLHNSRGEVNENMKKRTEKLKEKSKATKKHGVDGDWLKDDIVVL